MNMKKTLSYFLYTMLIACIVCACSDEFSINQVYTFDLLTMPVPKKIVEGETIEIRCQLVQEGEYSEAQHFIRYFQNTGKGELRLDGTVFLPNDLYPLTKTVFRLYYTSLCSEQQTISVYIEDGFGQVVEKTFSFQNDKPEE
ncbi:conjugal transfer protein [Bacteroidia bacterium]|nr:conjugal transfer protein [Bacteroidia bacterium]